jgi:CheY-like chemotaxis protein
MKAYVSDFTILIVDDDEGHVELLRRNLSRIALGNPLVALHDGERALDYIFRRGEFAGRAGADPLILLDINMPGKSAAWRCCARSRPIRRPARRRSSCSAPPTIRARWPSATNWDARCTSPSPSTRSSSLKPSSGWGSFSRSSAWPRKRERWRLPRHERHAGSLPRPLSPSGFCWWRTT